MPPRAKTKAKLDAEMENDSIVDMTHGLALVLAPKDDSEWDLMKKSSVLSNKVMKHGCMKRLEEIIEEEEIVTEMADGEDRRSVGEGGKLPLSAALRIEEQQCLQ